MSCILHIETSTTVCSIALSLDGKVVFERVHFEGPSHASLLGVYIEETIAFLKERQSRPKAIALSSGPGSYTGLRIGTSMAKGLCMGWDIPLIAIPTLQLMALQAIRRNNRDDCLYCAMLDARRMEVYSAIFDASLAEIRYTSADIVSQELFQPYLDRGAVCLFGDGAAKCRTVIASENALFLDDIYPLARDMVALAEQAFMAKKFEDTAYFEPFYLKEFMATTPKQLII